MNWELRMVRMLKECWTSKPERYLFFRYAHLLQPFLSLFSIHSFLLLNLSLKKSVCKEKMLKEFDEVKIKELSREYVQGFQRISAGPRNSRLFHLLQANSGSTFIIISYLPFSYSLILWKYEQMMKSLIQYL